MSGAGGATLATAPGDGGVLGTSGGGNVGSGFDGSVADFMVGASPRSAEGAGWSGLAT